jgi:hypothetical protein
MSPRSHIRISLIVTAVWVLFWLLGWPDYYQQYSTRWMVIFVIALIPLFWILIFRMLRSIKSKRIYKSIILSIYFTVPFFIYDYIYCGMYLGNGMKFLTKYWYLTIYYVIPWIMVPLTAVWMERIFATDR